MFCYADYLVDCSDLCLLVHQCVKQMSLNYQEVMVCISYHALFCKYLVSYF